MRRGPRASLYRDRGEEKPFPRRNEGGSVKTNEGSVVEGERRAEQQPLAGTCRCSASQACPEGEVRSREHKSSVNCVCYIKDYFLSLHPLVSGVIFSQLLAGPGTSSAALRPLRPEQHVCLRVHCCFRQVPEPQAGGPAPATGHRTGLPPPRCPPWLLALQAPGQTRLVWSLCLKHTALPHPHPHAWRSTSYPELPSSPLIPEPQPRPAPGPALHLAPLQLREPSSVPRLLLGFPPGRGHC